MDERTLVIIMTVAPFAVFPAMCVVELVVLSCRLFLDRNNPS